MSKIEHPIDQLLRKQPRIDQLRSQMLQLIPRKPTNDETLANLQRLPINRLMQVYINWINRIIPPRRRQVSYSDHFWKHGNPAKFTKQFNEIDHASEKGDDLTPYLSRKAMNEGYVANPKPRRGIFWGDKDMALNAYGIHHLHLTPCNSSGRRPGKNNELLFVGFSRTKLILIMLGDHKSFDDGELFQAATEFRASSGWDIKSVLPPKSSTAPVTSQKLVRRGISAPGQSGDRMVVTSLISSAGTSVMHTQHADKCCIAIEQAEPNLMDRELLAQHFRVEETNIPETPEWQWQFWYGDLWLTDRWSGKNFLVVPWHR